MTNGHIRCWSESPVVVVTVITVVSEAEAAGELTAVAIAEVSTLSNVGNTQGSLRYQPSIAQERYG